MLRPEPLPPVPAETARIARAAFQKGYPYLAAADVLGEVFTDGAFAALFPRRGQPALAPWRLALATILQFAEGLSDRQAADAVRARLDWKYVLRLEPTDPGFDASVLCEFRGCLVAGEAAWLLFEALPTWARTRQLLRARGRQRTDATHVLAAVRALNRLEVVGETLRHALDRLAVAAPAWLRPRCRPTWQARYGRRIEDADLPEGQAAREAFAVLVGGDGHALLAAACAPDAPAWRRAAGDIPPGRPLQRLAVRRRRPRRAHGDHVLGRLHDPPHRGVRRRAPAQHPRRDDDRAGRRRCGAPGGPCGTARARPAARRPAGGFGLPRRAPARRRAERFRARRFPARLGAGTGDLPGRADE